jgi:hypothetical protein
VEGEAKFIVLPVIAPFLAKYAAHSRPLRVISKLDDRVTGGKWISSAGNRNDIDGEFFVIVEIGQ